MDLNLYARVLRRFRLLVAFGVLLASMLAFLSIAKVSSGGLEYREEQLWSAELRLLVTQQGFPEGRLYAQRPTQPGDTTTTTGDDEERVPVADPARFNTLAILYAELAASDPVRRLMTVDRGPRGVIVATPLRDELSGVLLPLIDIRAISDSPRGAANLARDNAKALNTFISERQRVNDVPTADRVVLQTIVEPRRVELFQPRSKTMAMVVFLAVLFATVGLAFVLENTRPRRPSLTGPAELRDSDQRRTA
jgi:hypothetical protein